MVLGDLEDCMDGWVAFTHSCYLIKLQGKAWQGAQTACKRFGGHLVAINSEAEFNFLKSEILKKLPRTDYQAFWTGGKKRNNSWVWMLSGGVSKLDTISSPFSTANRPFANLYELWPASALMKKCHGIPCYIIQWYNCTMVYLYHGIFVPWYICIMVYHGILKLVNHGKTHGIPWSTMVF